jgi:thiamine pyrophosphate-dependent acetolactate synthase large subunit-like protein
MTKGSDLLVAALENEGVDRIFGIPAGATHEMGRWDLTV